MKTFSLSIVIPTYDRYTSLMNLIHQIQELNNGVVAEIIVVDSTDKDFKKISLPNVKQIVSPYKNALFQRYLGWKTAQSPWLLCLDDDMEIVNKECFLILEKLIVDKPDVFGFGLAFTNKHNNSVISNLPKSITAQVSTKSFFRKTLRTITGYPELKDGSYFYCGLRGPQPANGGRTEWFSGGAFLARKESLFKNFNLQMCDLFEVGLGLGEDVLLAYTLSKQGEVEYVSEVLFVHNDQGNSRFTVSLTGYARRVFYSRLYLSLEYARLNGTKLYHAYLFYNWYFIFRMIGMIFNFLLRPSRSRSQLLAGGLMGWVKSFSLEYDDTLACNYSWSQKADRIVDGYSE